MICSLEMISHGFNKIFDETSVNGIGARESVFMVAQNM